MDLFQTAKLLRPIHHLSPLHAQMKAFQKRKSLLNEAILQYRMRKTSSCFKIIHHQLGLDDDTVCLLLVAASNTSKQQIMLMDFIKERPISIPLHLALIQLQLQSNQTDQALITLLGLLQARTVIPIALSALLIWLLQQTGQSERAYEILDSISDRLMAQRTHLPLLKQIASFHLKSQRYQVAQKQYEFLVRFDPTDAQSIAGLITAYMITEPQKADKYAATLPKVNINHLDAKVLEYSIPGVQSKIIDHATKMKKKKMKKKRKPLLPKGAENQTLDPERWLPLSQRTSSKK
jgi:signal recognition particle subunit SRP72